MYIKRKKEYLYFTAAEPGLCHATCPMPALNLEITRKDRNYQFARKVL